ncbi:DUF1827 family protein [Vaginisenegalia massiliensis]|uniref:DUF1827 family protein n=1 Tax=Vaginisenegalia massiliensis TaxID=2058294 RepID=UPI000F531EC0|nr:DUF1827 family protein [Vaginisenegalia massiliensis]
MKMIDVTNSHYELVTQQLANTDASVIKVFTIGPTSVIYSEAPSHTNIVMVNKKRPIRQKEIDFTIKRLLLQDNRDQVDILEGHNFIEIEYYGEMNKLSHA